MVPSIILTVTKDTTISNTTDYTTIITTIITNPINYCYTTIITDTANSTNKIHNAATNKYLQTFINGSQRL